MQLNYENRFKDRAPQDTITIIKNFFDSKNCNIIEHTQLELSGTYSAQLSLYYNNNRIATSNGKGMTELFCKASAYAELYERFANKIFTLSNYIINERIMNFSYKENGFYLSPKEKLITFEEAFDSIIGQYYLNNMCDDISELKEVFSTLFNNKFIGLPFHNIFTDEIRYFDPRILLCLTNSSGMAAGNNFYEAFNQGMSEIYEHIITGKYLVDHQEKYYSLNLNNIKNNDLQNVINNIQKDNFLYIFDMSYIYKVPVLMSLIVNKKTHTVTINIGASPVFEIAVERVLTELYQGTYSFNDIKLTGQLPLKTYCDSRLADAYWPGSTMTRTIFPEFIINNIETVETCSSTFLTGSHSNEEIYKYIVNLNKQLDLDTYYYDCSLDPNMTAIKIFVRNLPILIDNFSFGKMIKNKSDNLIFILELMNFINEYLDSKNCDTLLHLIEKNQLYINKLDNHYINNILMRKNQFIVSAGFSHTQNVLELCEKILFDSNFLLQINCEMPNYYAHTMPEIYKQLIQYIIIYRYLNDAQFYETSEILQILDFLNINYSLNDIEAYLNNDNLYWIEKIAFIDLNKIKAGAYNDYIELIANCNWTN